MKRIAILACITLAHLPTVASAQAAAEPAAVTVDDIEHSELATRTVDFVFPSGTYARIMNTTMDALMDNIMDSVTAMPIRDLAALGGIDKAKLDELGPGTMREMMLILDPAFEERMKLSTRAMMSEMTTLMTQVEPSIRDGLASAYSSRFDARQLAELNAFFATPTGRAYAEQSMVIFTDKAVMAKMQEFMPAMMKQMPAIIEKVGVATAKLPAPRKVEDLSKAERGKLAELIGVPEDKLDKPAD